MSDLDQRIVALRRKLSILRAAHQETTNDTSWRIIRAYINTCFMAYIELVERRAARDPLGEHSLDQPDPQ